MAEYIERELLINHVEDLPTWGTDGNLLDREDVIGSIENRIAADVVPIETLERLRDELYEQDLITMEGLRKLNALILKYTTVHDGGADNG